MGIQEFTKVSESESLRFIDIWKIYDSQFEAIRNFLMTLGDKYVVEEFTGSTSKTLSLSHSYSSGQLFLYKNGAIQWKDTDYIETSSKVVTLVESRKTTDVIKVVVIQSNVLQVNVEYYVKQIQEIYDSSVTSAEKAQKLIETLNVLEVELEEKRNEFDAQKKVLEDFLGDFDEKVERTEENVAKVESMKESVDSDLLESDSCLKQIKTLKESIEALSLLTPDEIVDNEVVLARNGAVTLGDRLNHMIYKFKTIEEMQQCQFLKDGDECIVADDTNRSSIVTAKLFRICTLAEDIPSYVTEYYRILIPDYKYAYVTNEIISKPYFDMKSKEYYFELDAKSKALNYGLTSLIIENFEDMSSFNTKDDSTNKTITDFWNQSTHVVESTGFSNNMLKTVTFTLNDTPSYLMVMCDYEGSGTVDLSVSFDGGTRSFSVTDGDLVDLSNITLDNGKQMHPSVKLIGYITLNGNVSLKNICWGTR
jgi:hypothetical protein